MSQINPAIPPEGLFELIHPSLAPSAVIIPNCPVPDHVNIQTNFRSYKMRRHSLYKYKLLKFKFSRMIGAMILLLIDGSQSLSL